MIQRTSLLYLLLMGTIAAAEPETQICEKLTPNTSRNPIATKAVTFCELVRNSNIFVDKSRLIKAVLEESSKIILISRPRYWGKSVNLDMIKSFIDVYVDINGNQITPISSTPMYRLFVDGELSADEKLKKPLLIASERTLIDDYLAQYPVIHLNLTNIQVPDIESNEFAVVMLQLKERVRDTFIEHRYMMLVFHDFVHNSHVNESEKRLVRQHFNFFTKAIYYHKKLSDKELKESLHFLSELLHRHFKKPVFVTVDDYDALLNLPYVRFNVCEPARIRILTYYTQFLATTLKNNDHLKKAVLTGRFPLTKEDIASYLDGITEYTFLNSTFMEYYGFQKYEVNEISTILQTSENITQLADSRFGSYYFPSKKLSIYNPQFIVDLLARDGTQVWLDMEALINYLRFFIRTGVNFTNTFVNAFQPASSNGGGHKIDTVFLEGGHFTRNELEIFHKALKLQYIKRYDTINVRLSIYNLSSYDTMSENLEKYRNEGKPAQQLANVREFDAYKFLHKIYLFLYTLGYLSLTQTDDSSVVMEYPAKNPDTYEPIMKIIHEENARKFSTNST